MNRWEYLEAFKEPSTWAGLAVLAGLFGVPMVPEQIQAAAQAGTAVAATLAVFMPERGRREKRAAKKAPGNA
jgi:hypothetical protein